MNEPTRYKDRPAIELQDHVSLDIETLSRQPEAIVISIAAVTADFTAFDEHLNLDEQMDLGRDMESETVVWHMRKRGRAYAHDLAQMHRATKLKTSFQKLEQFFQSFDMPPRIWMRHPHFDEVVLRSLARDMKIELPWEYWQVEDLHTLINLARTCKNPVNKEMPEPPSNAHDALADAVYQLEIVNRCIHILNCHKEKSHDK